MVMVLEKLMNLTGTAPDSKPALASRMFPKRR